MLNFLKLDRTIFAGLSGKTDPEKFEKLWTPFINASLKTPPSAEKKKKSLLDIPAVQGVVAIREEMLALGIKPLEASAYGSRLSLAAGLHENKEAMKRFGEYITVTDGKPDIKPAMLKAIAICELRTAPVGHYFDFDILDATLNQFLAAEKTE